MFGAFRKQNFTPMSVCPSVRICISTLDDTL